MGATESVPSSGSCEVFTVGRKNLFSTSAGSNGAGQQGMGQRNTYDLPEDRQVNR